ncbi:FAD binding domain-containing protein [Marinobacter vulgaris]|uniref:FAD binding domain-containing protein n=1 Tax=Marinobacter vulgaris TaxID=1928331 RepID=UPI0018F12366|nr:FAD binding domain-containing protein [Marinobacter vulgaris]
MNDNIKPRAIIVGGSLAGLFNAIMLRSIGWQVDIFERTPHALESRGGGIVLQPEVELAFELAGLKDYPDLGVVSHERLFLNDDGSIAQRMHGQQTLTSWPMLYNTMRNAIPDDNYHLNSRLVSVSEEDDSKVTAVFEDGRVVTGDLLIGADGVNSTVRSLMLPGITPDYAGYVAWRGLVKEGELDPEVAELLSQRFVFHQYPGSHILQYLIPAPDGSTRAGDRYFNWVWYRNVSADDLPKLLTDRTGRSRPTSVPPGLAKQESVDEMHVAAKSQLAPQMARLVLATKEPFIQAILDLSVNRMVFGRVILTGDAAFVPRPHTAASTSKAAANAIDLAVALRHGDENLGTVLAHWEQRQIALGERLQSQGQMLGNRSQFPASAQ